MKKFIIISAALLCLTACEDFLGEKYPTDYGQTRAISTTSALESNILGCQKTFASSGFKTGAFCETLAPASGLAIWGPTTFLTNPLERWTCCHKFTRFSKHPGSYDSFSSFYSAIYRCNSLIESLPDSPVSESYKKEIEGEALFLRAVSYFYLVRLYGDVTLTTKVPKKNEDVYGERANFWEVYNQIVKDLTTAFDEMRNYNRMIQIAGGNSSGRVCNYAAKAYRSLVYLTIGSMMEHSEDNFWLPEKRQPDFSPIGISNATDAYTKARDDAEDVINNGPFELCEDYRQLFRWDKPEDWQLKERIFALPRTPEAGDAGSGLSMWALPISYEGTYAAQNYGRCRPDRFFFQKWCERYGGKMGTNDNNKNIYVSCGDPRMDVNLIYTAYNGANMKRIACYPSNPDIFLSSGNGYKHYGMPYYKKYYDKTFDNNTGNADLYLMRFAEVYLISAEAHAYLGDFSTAVQRVNKILERARRYDKNGNPSAEPKDWDAADYSNKEDLINDIIWERCFEMPFEHHEYFDTHRFGAQWLVDNISVPKNAFLYAKEQEDFIREGVKYSGYRTYYYGKDFKYDEDWKDVRKGLINGYPNDELVYNSCLDVNLHDPNKGQNPEEVFWR